jgi:hypothetical protein
MLLARVKVLKHGRKCDLLVSMLRSSVLHKYVVSTLSSRYTITLNLYIYTIHHH